MMIISKHRSVDARVPRAETRHGPRVYPGVFVPGLLAVLLGGCDGDTAGPIPATQPEPASVSAALSPARDDTAPTRYFFDVHGHTAAEITALLRRAQTTHDALPEAEQDAITIAIVLHGPDVTFFAADNYSRYRELVDLAADLDARGYVDLKACTVSVNRRGLDATRFPPFIEFVPFGPDEIDRLKAQGYVRF